MTPESNGAIVEPGENRGVLLPSSCNYRSLLKKIVLLFWILPFFGAFQGLEDNPAVQQDSWPSRGILVALTAFLGRLPEPDPGLPRPLVPI